MQFKEKLLIMFNKATTLSNKAFFKLVIPWEIFNILKCNTDMVYLTKNSLINNVRVYNHGEKHNLYLYA